MVFGKSGIPYRKSRYGGTGKKKFLSVLVLEGILPTEWRRAKTCFEKNPGHRESWVPGFQKILVLEENIRYFLTHFLVNFRVVLCPYWPKGRKMVIFGKKPCVYTLPPFFFGPLFEAVLGRKGHFSCFSKKVSFMGGGKKKVVFSHFLFSIKKIHKFTVFRL